MLDKNAVEARLYVDVGLTTKMSAVVYDLMVEHVQELVVGMLDDLQVGGNHPNSSIFARWCHRNTLSGEYKLENEI